MDNILQIIEIHKYRTYLCNLLGKDIDFEMSARIWIKKYAELWRLRHPIEKDNGNEQVTETKVVLSSE
ncbi:MAG: hypothetical protein GX267_01070 [Fibrobacter sp.]|jgi:hypothetical protein|nr:hypothetical protein [Fibrobacter sp.]